MNTSENGKAPAFTEADPQTANHLEGSATVRPPARPSRGFFAQVCAGKTRGFVDRWDDDRDLLTGMEQLEAAIAEFEVVRP